VDRETQTVSFSNWAQQGSPVQSEWDVTFTCNDNDGGCVGQYFNLTLFETTTGNLFDVTAILYLRQELELFLAE